MSKAGVERFRIRGLDGSLDGPVYEFDGAEMTVEELRVLSKKGGIGLTAFGIGLRMGNPEAIVARLYLAKRRAGEAVRWEDFDDFQLSRIVPVPDAEQPAEQDGEADDAVDPTTTPPIGAGTT